MQYLKKLQKIKTDIQKPCIVLATRIGKWYNPIDMGLIAALGGNKIHSELVFLNLGLGLGNINSFSSRGRVKNIFIPGKHKRKEKKGVRFSYVDYYKGKWKFTLLQLNTAEVNKVYNKARTIIGCGYDTPGAVFNCGFDLPVDKKDKYWCSEACAYALKEVYKIEENLTPEELEDEIFSILKDGYNRKNDKTQLTKRQKQ